MRKMEGMDARIVECECGQKINYWQILLSFETRGRFAADFRIYYEFFAQITQA